MAPYGIPTKEEPFVATGFWHRQGAILVNSVSGGAKVNSGRYIGTLSILNTRLLRALSARNMLKIMILHDYPKPYQCRRLSDRQNIFMDSVTAPILQS
jgi:hypothetical protein